MTATTTGPAGAPAADPATDPATCATATSTLRRAGYAAILTAAAFAQSPGRIVPDTKFDLVAAPWRFLTGATHLWDPTAAFGQVQNQADGYLWPMGPFFLLGRLAALPEWVVQRLWWALLLNLAFFGVLRLLKELRIGGPWSQVAAAAAFVLAPRMTSILGETSVELWPAALAPWVLVPLVRGSQRGSVVRAGAVAALLVACCGGVNATAVSAAVPAGVIWLLTRARGPRRFRLLGWWGLFTVLATLWWLVPLVLLGRYAAPFLDYIENAALTSSVTDVGNSLVGTSNWTSYFGGGGYAAGSSLVSTPFVLLDAAAVAALGLAGLARRDHPHRRFVVLLLLGGLVLVGLGHAGEVHGWFAADRRSWLDGALAALRNTHKYDVLIRLALSLGIAHVLAQPLPQLGPLFVRTGRRLLVATTALVLVGLAFPWVRGDVAAPGGFTEVPRYWKQAAAYVGDRPGTTLVVPAASFGDYTWGSTHDDVLQPYATGPWAVRNVVPLAQPGNVRLLDEVTELLEGGQPTPRIAQLLATAGVGTLVVRNDLDRLVTGAPDPAYLHGVLDASPGLSRVAGFGAEVGDPHRTTSADGEEIFFNHGLSQRYSAVEVYAVSRPVQAALRPLTTTEMGDPGDGLVLTGDAGAAADDARVVLTDGMRRREIAFQAVRDNAAATAPAGSAPLLPGREQFHRILADQERWQATETWRGVAGVTASSSQAFADAGPPLARGDGPGAAVDGNDVTAWRTPRTSAPDRQWLDVRFEAPTDVDVVVLLLPRGITPVDRVTVTAGGETATVRSPASGRRLTVHVGARGATSLRVTAHAAAAVRGSWGIDELRIPGVKARRVLALPTPPAESVVDQVRLARDTGATSCPAVDDALVCLAVLGASGEDDDRLDRSFSLPADGDYQLAATASIRRRPGLSDRLLTALGVDLKVTGSAAEDVAESPVAMVDGDAGTTWHAEKDATVRLGFPTPRLVRSVSLEVGDNVAASRPDEVEVSADGRSVVGHLTDGRIEVPGWTTSALTVKVRSWKAAVTVDGATAADLDPGISELRVNSSPVVDGVVSLPCGRGPFVNLDGTRIRTSLTGRLAALLRGEAVPVRLCDDGLRRLTSGGTTVLSTPSRLLRAETISLTRPDSVPVAAAMSLSVARDDRGSPTSADVPARSTSSVISLPQNFNAAWQATLGGKRLQAQRVDGWQQGWVVPAGAAGTVTFTVPADLTYRIGLGVGVLGVVVVLLVVALARRAGTLPALTAAPPGLVDVVLVVGAVGLLAGTLAAAATLALVVVCTVRPRLAGATGWGLLAAGATLLAILPRVVDRLDGRTAEAQWSATLAVVLVAGSFAASLPRFFRRRAGDSSQR